ncbi:porin [Hoeflea sp. YIM 152468]|uniref:porin n=1 Tax=Hoeflea sp. YIM 152468 TaxID=3031759 RepID=UPI0023D9FC59|nr:porin [Hoeflea sp. YIM 152468]MDF1609629.1 porin [Hoeflea sp. YIM 152468]
MRTNLAAICSIAALGIAVPGHAVAEPDEYVRVCDSYGSGFFYIPGTETCLRLTGYVDYQTSWLKNTHSIGGGTVVRGAGGPSNELFGATYGNWIRRDGLRVGFRTSGDYGDAKIGDLPLVGAYIDYEGAWGDEGYQGSSVIGADNVTQTGFTFLQQHPMYGTGVIASTNGFGLDSSGTLGNSWHRANLGLKFAVPGFDGSSDDADDDRDGLRVRGRLGLFYETLDTDATGRSDLTFNGTPFNGFYQNYDLDAKDEYFGVRLGTHIGLPPCLDGKFKTSIGADLYLGYHTGKGYYSHNTGAFGTQINETRSYSESGFTVGAGVSLGASYEIAPGWRLGSKVEFSYLPQVTSFSAPQNPSEQANAGFSSDSATRVIASFGLRVQF